MKAPLKACLFCQLRGTKLPSGEGMLDAAEGRALAYYFLGQYAAMNPPLAQKVARESCDAHKEYGAILEQALEDVFRAA